MVCLWHVYQYIYIYKILYILLYNILYVYIFILYYILLYLHIYIYNMYILSSKISSTALLFGHVWTDFDIS